MVYFQELTQSKFPNQFRIGIRIQACNRVQDQTLIQVQTQVQIQVEDQIRDGVWNLVHKQIRNSV